MYLKSGSSLCMFSEVNRLIKIILLVITLVITVSVCTAEIIFPAIRRLKTSFMVNDDPKSPK